MQFCATLALTMWSENISEISIYYQDISYIYLKYQAKDLKLEKAETK